MIQTERIGDGEEAIRTAIEGHLINTWTCLPAIIQSVNEDEGTCTAQPTIQGQLLDKDGNLSWVDLPLLVDVPIVFPGGGGFVATFPIKKDNEALIIFSSRCIDNWWQAGGIQAQAELRHHDLSDGFAIVGPRSKPNVIKSVSTSSAQLRTEDGSAYVELAANGVINIVAPGGLNVKGAVTTDQTIAAQGAISTQAGVLATQDGVFNGHSVSNHTHVDPQGGVTGPAVG